MITVAPIFLGNSVIIIIIVIIIIFWGLVILGDQTHKTKLELAFFQNEK